MICIDQETKLPEGARRTMSKQILSVDEQAIKTDLAELVRSAVQQVINSMLDEEADELVGAERYGRTVCLVQ